MKPIKVLHIITGLGRGGAESMLFKLLQRLPPEKGIRNSILTLLSLNQFDFESIGVPVESLDLTRGIPSPGALLRMRRAVKSSGADIVQGWMYHGNFAAVLASLPGTKVCWNIRHSLHDIAHERRLTRWLIRGGPILSQRVAKIIYCSKLSQIQHEEFGYPANKSVFIPNGFDLEKFKPSVEARDKFRRNLGTGENSVMIGHVARFHPMKNHTGLIRAFAKIARSDETVHLVLIGRDVTQDNPEISAVVKETGTVGRVHLLGERKDIQDLLPAFDLYVSSSLWGEAFPNVLGEAMACGVPCVTTDIGDSADIVGETGFIADSTGVEDMARALEKALAVGAGGRKLLGMKARERAVTEYSIDSVADRYARLYRSLVAP